MTCEGYYYTLGADGIITKTGPSTITKWDREWEDKDRSADHYWVKKSLVDILKFNNNAFLVAIKKFYEEYRSKIGFMSTSSTPATKLAAEILCEPTIKFKDAKEAVKYVKGIGTIAEDGTFTTSSLTIEPKTEATVQTYQDVTLDMELIVKDLWGKTMYVPFQIKVNTK